MVNVINESRKLPVTFDEVPQELWRIFGNVLLEYTTLHAATAVFVAMVDDVHSCSLELLVAGDAPKRHRLRSCKRMISMAHETAERLRGMPALEGASARALSRGSPDAIRWYHEWATVYLQTFGRLKICSSETLRPDSREQLKIRLRFKHANGQRTVLTWAPTGTAMKSY